MIEKARVIMIEKKVISQLYRLAYAQLDQYFFCSLRCQYDEVNYFFIVIIRFIIVL